MKWSDPTAWNKTPDYFPTYYAEARYFINFAILKAHLAAVTLGGKNHYGSLNRRPVDSGYYDMHQSLTYMNQGSGQYRALVDLMGHEHTGGKTLLYILDGLWGGYSWGGVCPPVKWRMAPFNNDHPNSIFMSQDPVAIDSVGFDFWWEEDRVSWDYFPFANSTASRQHMPHLTGGEDALHEAAEANDPDSDTDYDPEGDGTLLESLGTHEHWNNATDMKYTRNLGTGYGIELITSRPDPDPVVGRYVFYNNSAHDGNDVAIGAADDDAIATDKQALVGGDATFANYTSYSRGINGVMIDIVGLPGWPTFTDIQCRVGDGATWSSSPIPAVMTRYGEGVDGSDRVTLVWTDGAITNQWLEATVKPTPATGLTKADVFYFGNAPGETGDSPSDTYVTAADVDGCAANPCGFTLDDFVVLKQNFGATGVGFAGGDYDRNGTVELDDFVILKQNFGCSAAIDNPYDFDRDGRVNAVDLGIAEGNPTGPGSSLPMITIPQ